MKKITIEKLWQIKNFKPNENQEKAILYTEGPLLLTAGPGSGKTRVLLWRTLNLIVFHDVKPEEIFLSTFTEKAALQLKNGLYNLLGIVTNETNIHYDLAKMSLGTVHSICRRFLTDKRFSEKGSKKQSFRLLDELSQYLKIYDKSYWKELIAAGGFPGGDEANRAITAYLNGKETISRHSAVAECIALFNRFSEESIDPGKVKTKDKTLSSLLKMYDYYQNSMALEVDLSFLQQAAYKRVISRNDGNKVFRHIIIDEYQDTNAIQEKLFFALAEGHKNICVVGDDDQSLYRFRGSTVENLVEFEKRCYSFIKKKPERIDLNINYRSRNNIVRIYTDFIEKIDWKKKAPQKGHYRIADKDIKAHSTDRGPSVIVSKKNKGEYVYEEIARLVYELKKKGKIKDYNECAFLFPYLKDSSRVEGFKKAFSDLGIPVYAPRAGNFLKVDEAMAVWGLFLKIFDRPESSFNFGAMAQFSEWMDKCISFADDLCIKDSSLSQYIEDRKQEIETVLYDYNLLLKTIKNKGWKVETPFNMKMADTLVKTEGLSEKAKKHLRNAFFRKIIQRKLDDGQSVTLKYIISRLTSLDWSVLDLFYQLNGFRYFIKMYELAEEGKDEGHVCNLGLITQYLARFMEENNPIITASFLSGGMFGRVFFSSYTYALFRRGESEFEDPEDPFPKGRVPFITIHQAKGLEFPAVVLGSVFKKVREADIKEKIIRDLLGKQGEPLEKISLFDNMRMFYVALSRAKNLLILPRYTYGSSATDEFKKLFTKFNFPETGEIDISSVPEHISKDEDPQKAYSYTGDYLGYEKWPRNYMIFHKYGFVPSRSQTMFFGSLVHQTIEDLHNMLINERQ